MDILDAFKNDEEIRKAFAQRVANIASLVIDAYRYTVMADILDNRDTCSEGKKVMSIPMPDWVKNLDEDHPYAFAASEAAKCGFYLGLLDVYLSMGISNENARTLAEKIVAGLKMTTMHVKPDYSLIYDDDEVPGITTKQAKAAVEEMHRHSDTLDAIEEDTLAKIRDAHNQAKTN